ncbi:MAG TPA: GGDEF domain-containing protein [Rhodocyclaceae bacterium]
MNKTLHRLWHQAWATILVEMSDQEIGWLVRARNHISLLDKRRTTMIVSRVRLIAGLFALLTPMWIAVDVAAFPQEVWLPLVVARLFATAAFALLMWSSRRMHTMKDAYRALAILRAIPTAFFLFSHGHMTKFHLEGIQAAFSTGYAFLPFVMLAGLSIFPLTLLEAVAFVSPLLLMEALGAITRVAVLDWPTFAASFWLMVLIAGVSTLAGLSQLAFIIVLVREAIRDGMTGCFSRQSGEELMELQFILSNRSGSALTAVFIDLDHFKEINDRFGHDAGDRALIGAVEALRSHLRMGDMLTRWGGEEFLLIMPNTTAPMACKALARVREQGFGLRPDGTRMTASMGIAERVRDGADDWRQLVEFADKRMYTAKQGGRDRVVGCDE